ncbi:hypothetical protein [Allopontixanthobacter sp.]|uniref:hypothetical protein n=1 Tax=Allopontixanthobacter sp. TaxID=2906452 RepID=UPI002AB8CAE0|nr:hypothetical protein [Allopontixanthobacter sp.]MDZ4308242.1 hypothetical protein [Allopontixanthobacter sp.]
MNDQIIYAATVLSGLGLVTLVALRGWQGWLALKERELDRMTVGPRANLREVEDRTIDGAAGIGMARIEIADLKERIRRLEAIASGVDL